MKLDETRDKLLAAALAHVPFDGWTGRALRAGAADLWLDVLRRSPPMPSRAVRRSCSRPSAPRSTGACWRSWKRATSRP